MTASEEALQESSAQFAKSAATPFISQKRLFTEGVSIFGLVSDKN